MKNLAIITGANSELAKPYIDHFKAAKDDTIATFESRPIETTKSIIGVKVDLGNSWETKDALINILNKKNIGEYDKIFLLHFVGKFFYEGPSMQTKVMKETYRSNVNTFENAYAALQQYLLMNTTSSKLPDITLFNIGSISDNRVGHTPWPSYSTAKNILRSRFSSETENAVVYGKNKVNSLFINAGTIDIEKERELRPFADQEYRLSPKEVFDASINTLLTARGSKELTLYKKHPQYNEKYEHETLLETHKRRVKEMGVEKGKYVPNLIQGVRNPNNDLTKNTLCSLFRHYYINHIGQGIFISIYSAIEKQNREDAVNAIKEGYERTVYTPSQILEFCKMYGILPKNELALFKRSVKELDRLLLDYITTRKKELLKLLENIDRITPETVDDVSGIVGSKFDALLAYAEKH